MLGYIYCVSNVSMPSILNFGITTTAPEVRLDDINGLSGKWRPPTPYKCEFAKRVCNIDKKITAIHRLLAKYRIHPEREFFRVSLEEARAIFDLLDDVGDDADANIENKKTEMKAFEERMLECLFQRADDLEADFVKRKEELRELNETIERRKNELANLHDVSQALRVSYPNSYITEY
jgi:polyhydroxyalkanoate synthesis regulator phasin